MSVQWTQTIFKKERELQSLAKNTAVLNGTHQHHGYTRSRDFGGEERIMKMVDGVVLVVDAYEGTMPQTRFVLKKSTRAKLDTYCCC